jgi:hypothetical protein
VVADWATPRQVGHEQTTCGYVSVPPLVLKHFVTDWSYHLEPALRDFLNDNHGDSPCAVFGPDGTCLLWTLKQPERLGASRSAGRWFDQGQKAEMGRLLKNEWTGQSTVPIQFAALGVRGTYYIQFDDGSPSRYDFRKYYQSLAEYVSRTRPHVMVRPTLNEQQLFRL